MIRVKTMKELGLKPHAEAVAERALKRAAAVAKPAKSGSGGMSAGLQALGRLKAGVMNKTEAAYAAYLDTLKHDGLVLWYCFEGMKFRLADNTFYTPDFAVMWSNSRMEYHEVKGSLAIFQDDAKVKIKVAAEHFPFVFRVVVPKSKKDGGGWSAVEVTA